LRLGQVADGWEQLLSICVGFSASMSLLSNLLVDGEPEMTITIEAIYENGVFRPTRPLPLKERQMVRITIEPELSWAERTAGLLKWTGDPDILQRIAEGDEFSILESP
jgi:predicted DNA-binding antitoxin AbrB/MazE fold protein